MSVRYHPSNDTVPALRTTVTNIGRYHSRTLMPTIFFRSATTVASSFPVSHNIPPPLLSHKSKPRLGQAHPVRMTYKSELISQI